jgi:hypothetical protein
LKTDKKGGEYMGLLRIVLIAGLFLYMIAMIYLYTEQLLPFHTMTALVCSAIVFIILNIYEVRKLLRARKKEYERDDKEEDIRTDQAAEGILKKHDTSSLEISAFALAMDGEVEKLRAFLNKKPEKLTSRDDQKKTLLHYAVISGDYNTVKFLLSRELESDAKDAMERTPLHYAAEKGTKEIMELLISTGAKVNSRDSDGLTPLNFAMKAGKKEIEAVLLKKGAFVRPTN